MKTGDILIFDAVPAMADVISGAVPEPKAPGAGQVWWHWATRTLGGRRALDYIGCTVRPKTPWQQSADGWRVQPWCDPNQADQLGQFDHAVDVIRDALGEPGAGVLYAEIALPNPSGQTAIDGYIRSHRTMVAVNVDGTRAAVYRVSVFGNEVGRE